jgi:hypothetical protein
VISLVGTKAPGSQAAWTAKCVSKRAMSDLGSAFLAGFLGMNPSLP